jgi:hypothetical protein
VRLAHTHSDGFTRILVTTFLFFTLPIPVPNVHGEVLHANTSLVHDQGPVALLQLGLTTFNRVHRRTATTRSSGKHFTTWPLPTTCL